MIDCNHPYSEQPKKEPILLDKTHIEYYIYPKENLDFSNCCAMYLSTTSLTMCVMEFGPGGSFIEPDYHPGDEVYYILDGTIHLCNPKTGQYVEVGKGESVLIPAGTPHTGYNFQDHSVKVLALIMPKAHGYTGDKKFMIEHTLFRKPVSSNHQTIIRDLFTPIVRTMSEIGSWPHDGKLLREHGIIYPIREVDKLQTVHGNNRPSLVKFCVSNDLGHVGEYILSSGGQVASHTEIIAHQGETALFAYIGDIHVFFPEKDIVYKLKPDEGIYIPSNTKYQLINYESKPSKTIFCVSGNIYSNSESE